MSDLEHGPGYEEQDANVRTILFWGIGLAVVTILTLAAMIGLFDMFAARSARGDPAPLPIAEGLKPEPPPEPRLQIQPSADLETFRAAEERVLSSYGWVDENLGIVRIPIERAMDLVAERGLPAREGR